MIAAVTTGCSFQGHAIGDAAGSDHGGDATDAPNTDGADARLVDAGPNCYGAGAVVVCLSSPPDTALMLPTAVNPFDTGAGACDQLVPQTNGPDLCVLAGTTVKVSGNFIAIGTLPLVLVGTSTLEVSGTLDVSSTQQPHRTGAGANASQCPVPPAGTSDRGGAGGGAGGSFGTAGGSGGTGDLNLNGPPAGNAPGGIAASAMIPSVLRGGCPGATGGEGDDPSTNAGDNPGGPGGDGGGAVYLMAGTAITIGGNVFASGAGGGTIPGQSGAGNCVPRNGGFEQGGGGAGTGGMIGLAAPSLTISGRVVANGGAGGGGGGCLGGTPGGDGTTMMWNAPAMAGVGDHPGLAADGGSGSALGHTTNLDGVSASAGAGGGAGGLGVVWIDGTLQGGAMVSPAPSAH